MSCTRGSGRSLHPAVALPLSSVPGETFSRAGRKQPGMRLRLARFVLPLTLAACSGGENPAEPVPAPRPVATVAVAPLDTLGWAGDTVRFNATLRDAGGLVLTGRTVAWSSDQPAVATVDAAGLVTALGPGRAVISAASEGRSGTAGITVATYDLLVEGYRGGTGGAWRVPLSQGSPELLQLPTGMAISDPTPSPDGRMIAFVVADYVDNTGDIWLVNRDGSGLRNLTGDGPLDDAPAWSPDGSRLAYRSFREENFGDIWTIRVDGTGRANLTPRTGTFVLDQHRPDWSPDGTRIVYAGTGGGDWGIWVMQADGSQKRQLTSTPELDTEPVWSPDGKRIAFRRTGSAGSDLVLMAPDGTGVRVIDFPGQQRLPAWSPDGRLIAFVGQPTVTSLPEVFTMRPDGTDVRLQVGVQAFGPALHPDFLRRR